MIKLNSTWYKPPSLNRQMPQSYVDNCEHSYIGWWEEKWGKLWRDRPIIEVTSDVLRTPILTPAKVVGIKEGMEVTIRAVTKAAYCKEGALIGDKEVKCIGNAPAIYVVSHGGNRLDSFLKQANAKAFAERYVQS